MANRPAGQGRPRAVQSHVPVHQSGVRRGRGYRLSRRLRGRRRRRVARAVRGSVRLGRVDISARGCRSPKSRGKGWRANVVPDLLDSRFRGNDGQKKLVARRDNPSFHILCAFATLRLCVKFLMSARPSRRPPSLHHLTPPLMRGRAPAESPPSPAASPPPARAAARGSAPLSDAR